MSNGEICWAKPLAKVKQAGLVCSRLVCLISHLTSHLREPDFLPLHHHPLCSGLVRTFGPSQTVIDGGAFASVGKATGAGKPLLHSASALLRLDTGEAALMLYCLQLALQQLETSSCGGEE